MCVSISFPQIRICQPWHLSVQSGCVTACQVYVAVNRKSRTCYCSLINQACILFPIELPIRLCTQWPGVCFLCDFSFFFSFFSTPISSVYIPCFVCVFSFDSVSRCAMNRSAAWTASHPTPRRLNLCPDSTYSVHMDLCLEESDSHISMLKSIFF